MDTRLNYSISADIFEAAARADKPRNYLGMSEAGHPCDRYIWFRFRRFTPAPIEPRIYFLFRFGDAVEQLACTFLRSAGYKLENAWPDPQLGHSALGGLLKGHSDGGIYIPEGRALLEVKSANRKKFQAFALGGVNATYAKYYWQAQLYMGTAGFDRALFVIVNKDDSNIYTELVPFNKINFDTLISRLYCILVSPTWPDMQETDDCQYCGFRLHCKTKEGIQTEHSCMSCNFLQVRINGTAGFHCQNIGHPCQIHHPERICPEYSWIGTTPF